MGLLSSASPQANPPQSVRPKVHKTSPHQRGASTIVTEVQAAGAQGNPAEATGAWRYGKRYAFPTSPHPRRRLRTNLKQGATLTVYLVQNTGQLIAPPA